MGEQTALVASPDRKSLIRKLAASYDLEEGIFLDTVKSTVMPSGKATKEQMAAFLLVADQYGLNPFTEEIHAFSQGGGIKPVVGIDGFIKICNSHPQFDGMTHQFFHDDNGKLVSVVCRVFRKDRSHPTEAEEFLDECYRKTDPWTKAPHRMLKHRATIQAIRYAFGVSGIFEKDELEGMQDYSQAPKDVSPGPQIQARLESALQEDAGSTPATSEDPPPVAEELSNSHVPDGDPRLVKMFHAEYPDAARELAEGLPAAKKESKAKAVDIPFEVGPSDLKKALSDIGKFKSVEALKRHVQAREKLEWPEKFNEQQHDELRLAAEEQEEYLSGSAVEQPVQPALVT